MRIAPTPPPTLPPTIAPMFLPPPELPSFAGIVVALVVDEPVWCQNV